MRVWLRDFSLILLAGSAFVLGSIAPFAGGSPWPQAFAQGNSGDHADSHASDEHGNSDGEHGNSADAPGHVDALGSDSTPRAAVRRYVLENGLGQGDVAKVIKSWNGLDANEQAFLHNLNNPHSLLGKQTMYICDNAQVQASLDPSLGVSSVPTLDEYLAAEAYVDAAQLLADAMLDAATVLAAAPGTYTDEQVSAAMTVQDYMGGDPPTVIAAYEAEMQAETSFMTASVSYSGAYDPTTMGPVREQVDGIVAAKFGGDTSALCTAQ